MDPFKEIKPFKKPEKPKVKRPFTDEQYNTLAKEYLLILDKKSKQPAAQRAKIVEAFEAMVDWKEKYESGKVSIKIKDEDKKSTKSS